MKFVTSQELKLEPREKLMVIWFHILQVQNEKDFSFLIHKTELPWSETRFQSNAKSWNSGPINALT